MKKVLLLFLFLFFVAVAEAAVVSESYQLNWYDADFYTVQGATLEQKRGEGIIALPGGGESWQTMISWDLKLEGRSVYTFSFNLQPVGVGEIPPVQQEDGAILLKIKSGEETLAEANVSVNNPEFHIQSRAKWQGLDVKVILMLGHLSGGISVGHGLFTRVGKPDPEPGWSRSGSLVYDLSEFFFHTETFSVWDGSRLSVKEVNERRWGTMLTSNQIILVPPGGRVRIKVLGTGYFSCGHEGGESGSLVFKLSAIDADGRVFSAEKTQTLSGEGFLEEIWFDLFLKPEDGGGPPVVKFLEAELQMLAGIDPCSVYKFYCLWAEIYSQ